MAEPIEMLFGLRNLVGLGNQVLDGGPGPEPDPPPHEKGEFDGEKGVPL